MGFLSELFGSSSKETHDDGSTTERYERGTEVTRERDGSVRHYTRHETTHPLGAGEKITTTYGPHGEVQNVQRGWGKH